MRSIHDCIYLVLRIFEPAPAKRSGTRRGQQADDAPREFSAGAIAVAVFVCVLVVGIAAPRVYAQVENAVAATPTSLIMGQVFAVSAIRDSIDSAE